MPLPEVHVKTVTQQHVASPAVYVSTRRCPRQRYTQNSHATTRRLLPVAYTKESRNNTLPSPVVPPKTVTQQRVAFTGGKRKTIMQQHVAFTSGTRKSSHSTTRYCHHWKAQNKTRNNTLSSLVVHAKQSHNYTLPSPGTHAKTSHATTRNTQNSHATTRFLHQCYTQKQSRNNTLPALTGGIRK